jgi:Zn-dependent M28 family amino/carboxypeptidase
VEVRVTRSLVVVIVALTALAQRPAAGAEAVTEASVRGHMEFLASDALNGRGSGTRDEWLAATYIASHLRRWGIEPLGDTGGYVQTVDIPQRSSIVVSPPPQTWNVIGRIVGRDPTIASEVVLLSAHVDHLGAYGTEAKPIIFPGADDNGSGVVAVLELANAFARAPRPKRTIVFAWFGSEETDGHGVRHFVDAPPVPLDRIVANLEFEMIGRPDPHLPPRTLWLAGYDRTTLGPALAMHGARIVADPRPEQRFFERSDNIELASRGVVAHTVSSFALHRDYHQPTDDLVHIDFAHLREVIQSTIAPVTWLANTTFIPRWRPGMQPASPTPRNGR